MEKALIFLILTFLVVYERHTVNKLTVYENNGRNPVLFADLSRQMNEISFVPIARQFIGGMKQIENHQKY